jgi:beta-lactamase regulating signal transducer with metallopeptidase domain
MRLLFSSALLGLAWFAAANIAVSLIAWAITRRLPLRTASGTLVLALRMLPVTSATVFAAGVFLPAHVRFEPAARAESFGIVLAVLAALALGLLCRTAWRLALVASSARRFAAATRTTVSRRGSAIFEVNGLPGVTLAGIFRPRILIGSEAMSALTPAELDVAIAHEVAHKRSHDNLKRLAIFCAPDVFAWCGAARVLEDRWQAAAECRADSDAARGDANRAVTLASALVKVAKLSARPATVRQSPAWSAFHVPDLLEMRVRRLVAGPAPVSERRNRLTWVAAMIALCGCACARSSSFAYQLHAVTESLVTILP